MPNWLRCPYSCMILALRAAEMVQLGLEYAPEPPFNSGRPDTAPAEVLEAVNARTAAAFAERRVRIDAWAAAHRVGQHA